MSTKNNKFKIYVLHFSHTDVGYTDTQEKMKAHHVAFIKEVLDIIDEREDFKWNCETYWVVECFLKEASQKDVTRFIAAVKNGRIGLSGSYLNLTELVPEGVYREIMSDCKKQRDLLGIEAKSALTADINGYSWGFADILAEQNITNLMSCIHTHHGYHPMMKKQMPFWWESPKGKKVLVWNGDHYNLGNELGFAQASSFEYTIQDGLTFSDLNQFDKSVLRIKTYVETIKEQGYEYPFVPISLSGNMTDNSPASTKIPDFIEEFNQLDCDIELEMCTLDDFFDLLQAQDRIEIPTYKGDWTDWWADGIGSTPADIIQYRRAARNYNIVEKMDSERQLISDEMFKSARHDLMFYGEHTWGYSSSITEPYHPQVNNLDQWKRLYALKASETTTIMLEKVQQNLGETALSLRKELQFKAVNPHNRPVKEMLTIDLEHFYGHENFDVVDKETGEFVPFQISRYSRGPEMCIWLDMKEKEEKVFVLKEKEKRLNSPGLKALTGIEGVDDLAWRRAEELMTGGTASIEGIENNYLKIDFNKTSGIYSIYDKVRDIEYRDNDKPYGMFTPIYEVTPREMGEDYLFVRRNLGRNRKAFRTERSVGKLCDVKILENGDLYSRVELKYDLQGTGDCAVILTTYHLTPKMDIDLRLHKDSVWEPENVYLSLPFISKTTYIDKCASIVRPRIDQLPGTCVDFYSIQNGLVFENDKSQILLSCQDTPLISMGTLDAHNIRLMGDDVSNTAEVYSWVMNNFWETNFKASLGGFYQFHYEMEISDKKDVADSFEQLEAMNEGVLQFYTFE
ncbi:glycoside hydrolase family 38 C-terminal domain-containing protein [Enterococcus sp. S86.2]|uniref:glycoside hydrolase family 38 N-terminal domain-containing protein n=1 Tax=Enterococcus sp. S86.2 TaxID=3031299 RepID=UPI0026F09F16|nr:glycoside hydrolase family 38 C-terminal domain-containing protein [Enterococcus sp. S86.2]